MASYHRWRSRAVVGALQQSQPSSWGGRGLRPRASRRMAARI